jgi:hypothetical protein
MPALGPIHALLVSGRKPSIPRLINPRFVIKGCHEQFQKLSQQLSQINSQNDNIGWEAAIADAEAELRAASARRIALKASIKLFRRKLEEGGPPPEG